MKTPRKASPAREPRPIARKKARDEDARSKGSDTDPADESDGDAAAGKAEDAGMPDEVLEFVAAIDEYKRRNQRPFPTWSEVLGVLKSLGYRREARKAA